MEENTDKKYDYWHRKAAYFKQYSPVPPKKIKRECLKCEKKFTAEGKYNRICPTCKGNPIYDFM